jgi:hypothetical protein
LQQQKEAFYTHHFDILSQKELEQFVARFKPKKTSQFPPPEYIYTKQFAFLSVPLSILQQKLEVSSKRIAQEDNTKKLKPKEEVTSNTSNSGEKTEPKQRAKSNKKVHSQL